MALHFCAVSRVTITTLTTRAVTRLVVAEVNELLSQLHGDPSGSLSLSRWRSIVAQKDVRIFVMRAHGHVIGMSLLRWHELTGGRVGAVEDVVIHSDYRDKGLGGQLMGWVIGWAKKHQFSHLDLTSNPRRVAANALYQKLGFQRRETNVYRLMLKQPRKNVR